MEKINIAELLQGCPKGMELYSTIFGPVYFEGVRDTGNAVLIDVKTMRNSEYQFYPDGKFNTYYSDSEMTLFPSKDVRTWEGFIPPCNFKDGDIVATTNGLWIGITKGGKNGYLIPTYCVLKFDIEFEAYFNEWKFSRFATEEEKQKLFDAIKDNGYRWNAETKTLEKLIEPKFKVGDKIANDDYVVEITEIDSENEVYIYESKVGGIGCILLSEQDHWELVPNKFDINTLKTFDKVLVRYGNVTNWKAELYSHYDDKGMPYSPFCCIGAWYDMCIPYEGNEHLLGTDEDCDEYYKTWK